MRDLAREFKAFYVERMVNGLPVEFDVPLLATPSTVTDEEITKLIKKSPLDRFLIKKYIIYSEQDDEIQISPSLWLNLRYYEVLDVLSSLDEQLNYYYTRNKR